MGKSRSYFQNKDSEVEECSKGLYWCECKECSAKFRQEMRHISHPFYEEVRQYVTEIERQQIMKGAEKYPEPFNPDSWTSDELADHAMQENRDQAVYITGMRDRMRKLGKEVQMHKDDVIVLEREIEKMSEYLHNHHPNSFRENSDESPVDMAIRFLRHYKSHSVQAKMNEL